MRTSIQVINVVNRTQPFRMKCRDLTGYGIHFLRNPKLRGTAPNVIAGMGPALPFRQALDRRCPRVGAFSGGFINWKPKVIAQFGTRTALRFVFIKSWRPFAGKIHLSKDGDAAGNRYYYRQKSHQPDSVDCHVSLP